MDMDRELRELEAAANDALKGDIDDMLGRFVRARRRQLRLTQDLQSRGGPSAATVRAIEAGAPPDMQRGTKRGLEAALEWPEGSIDFLRSPADSTISSEARQRRYRALLEPPENGARDTGAADQDDFLGALPPGTLDGLSLADREEVLAIGKAAMLARAREIRREMES